MRSIGVEHGDILEPSLMHGMHYNGDQPVGRQGSLALPSPSLIAESRGCIYIRNCGSNHQCLYCHRVKQSCGVNTQLQRVAGRPIFTDQNEVSTPTLSINRFTFCSRPFLSATANFCRYFDQPQSVNQ